jgi:hypothetical protein
MIKIGYLSTFFLVKRFIEKATPNSIIAWALGKSVLCVGERKEGP